MSGPGRETLRVDRWLWFARFFKSRSLALDLVTTGRVRVNSAHVVKPSHPVGAGDVLTFPQGERIRIVRVLAVGQRRGPAGEAALLYEDLTPAEPVAARGGPRARTGGWGGACGRAA